MTELMSDPRWLAVVLWAVLASVALLAALALNARRTRLAVLEARDQARTAQTRAEADAAEKTGRLSTLTEARVELEQSLAQVRGEASRAQTDAARLGAERTALAQRLQASEAQLGEQQTLASALAEERNQRVLGEERLGIARRDVQDRDQLLVSFDARMREQFQLLAGSVLDEKTRVFNDSQRSQMDVQLKPLKDELEKFRRTLDERREQDLRERGGLMQELGKLKDLNHALGDEAKSLTRALRGEVKTQGNWGELLLERLLEAAGLRSPEHYETQVSGRGEGGARQQLDVVVRLPEARELVIDAKVSLVAWERYVAATEPGERERELKNLRQSMRTHVAGLAERRYTSVEGINSLDFVLMFVPIEAAFVEAVRGDDGLYVEAMEKNVVIVTASTLLATLRTVHALWKFETRNRNADRIAEQAGFLYDKFEGLYADLRKVESQLSNTQKSFEGIFDKLRHHRGNLVARVEGLRRLGARASKILPREDVEQALAEEADAAGDDDIGPDSEHAPAQRSAPEPDNGNADSN